MIAWLRRLFHSCENAEPHISWVASLPFPNRSTAFWRECPVCGRKWIEDTLR